MNINSNQITIIDPIYLPFTPAALRPHFVGNAQQQLAYYQASASRYRAFLQAYPNRVGVPIQIARYACQIEKDEKFWTATAVKSLIDSPSRTTALETLLSRAYGERPPIANFNDWVSCLTGRLELVLEAALPSPLSYVAWLRANINSQHFIPYVIHAAGRLSARALEGPTKVDALVVNVDNGFSLLIEAKVLSDISHGVLFDTFRNQMARNLDVLLEANNGLKWPLSVRSPENSLFLLLTPECFRARWHSRLYGRLFREYKTQPISLQRDLPHRTGTNWQDLSRRIGWLTFEEIKKALPRACPWL